MKIVDKLIQLDLIEKKDADLYEYSSNILKDYIFFSVLILIINIFTKNLLSTIIFLFFFFNLRRFCGGIHFDNSKTCLVFSVVVIIILPLISIKIQLSFFWVILMQLIFSFILYFFPVVDSPNKFLDSKIKKIYMKYFRINLLIYMLITLLTLYFNYDNLSKTILLVVIFTFFSNIFGWIKYKKS